ncbi:MAG: FecR domain-containing protein [Spirochaetaceae bacterium]|nr:FecR domain-containing protein [Spirochaetaceae bacterium]
MKKTLLTILIILLWLPMSLTAQSDSPVAILEYFEDPDENMVIVDDQGIPMTFFDMGESLPPGFSIKTGSGFAEIRLEPNGTIIKLAENTDFSISNLQGYKGSPFNEFSLLAGKIRTIAARTSGIDQYNVRTPTAVMGVRGTDFINEISGTSASVVVREGLVEVIPNNGVPLMVSQNQSVDTLAAVFEAVTLPQELVDTLFRSMAFSALSPAMVPGHSPLAQEQTAEEPEEEEVVDSGETESPISPPEPIELTEDDMKNAQEAKPASSDQSRKESRLAAVLRDIFEMEIGTTTINGNTFSKVIIQPEIKIGRFKMGLYLPVIYVDNLFDPDQYYRPAGNNEWSFGTDQNSEAKEILLDILRDTMLKIRYIEYGDQGWDPFYLKVGNLNNMSIGHGAIMNNYANDSEFPAIRKIGLNTGFSAGKFGMEFVSDDLSDPSILGSRIYINPINSYKAFQIGITGVADLFPARDFYNPSEYGDPVLISFGMDMELLKINRDNFKMMLFGDFSSMTSIFRESPEMDGTNIDSGVATELWTDGSGFKNYGVVAGLRGDIFRFNWALEYRLSTGIYKPSIFNAVYDRNKIQYLSEIIQYLEMPSDRGTVMGIYGEGGFSLKDKLAFSIGYFWPWEINDGNVTMGSDDKLNISLVIMKGLIPRIPLSGRISYERTHLIDTFRSGSDLTLFDANTVISGELVYPLAQTLDLAIGASSVIQMDGEGNMIMETDGVTPKVVPVINIETRIHF